MRPNDAVTLNGWVSTNRGYLTAGDRPTLANCAAKASSDLGFKVSTGALTDLMQSNGIETKRASKSQAERIRLAGNIELLTAENMQLKRILAKVYASDYVPADVKELVFAGLNEEIKQSIIENTAGDVRTAEREA